MFCKSCGQQMDDYALACPKCGAPTIAQKQPPSPPIQQYQPIAHQPLQYQQPVMPSQSYAAEEHVSVGGWIGIFCINLIPFVGWLVYIIMLFVWAFGNTTKKSLKNFAKATLIMFAIFAGLGVVAIVIAAIAGVTMADYFENMKGFKFDDFSNQLFIR